MRALWAKSRASVSAVFALALLAGCVGVGATPSSEQQSTTAAESAEQPTPTGIHGAPPVPSGGALEPGRYFVERGPLTAQTYSFEVPAGWEVQDNGRTVTKYPGAPDLELGFSVFIVDGLYAEPCTANQTIALRQ